MSSHDKVLLIHPLGYPAEMAGKDIARVANLMPPLGLLSIASYLEFNGIKADLIDCFAHPGSSEGWIFDYIRKESPHYIGVSCTTSSFPDTIRLLNIIKTKFPDICTVVGGPHASAKKEEVIEHNSSVDYVIVGEGEEAFLELIKAGGAPKGIRGLVCREGKDIKFNGHRSELIELDKLPFPAYEKLEGFPKLYQLPIFNYPKIPNTSCISSRGCPYKCSYCDRSVFRQTFRFNSAEYLYNHLKYLKSRWGIRHINFYDDQFTLNRKRVEEFCNKMINEPLDITYNCAVRAEHVDESLLEQMKSSGCWMISLGIETGDPRLLSLHRQNSDLDLMAERIRQIKNAGIRTKGLLMLGLPGESKESVYRSMDYVTSLPIDEFNLAKFTPFPGSPIYKNINKYGDFEEDYSKMDCMNFQFIPHEMTKSQLESLFQLFYKKHFQRPKVLLNYLSMIWKSPHSWLRFCLHIKDFLKFAASNKRISKK